jgi:hypothetical protein
MSHENSELDIADRQLLPTGTRPRVSMSREIGEAVITHTIFGKAKVRIIRKNDDSRRALWLTALAFAGVTLTSAAIWQGWFSSPQIEPIQNADSLAPVSAEVPASAPVASQPENVVGASSPTLSEPAALALTGANNPEVGKINAPQPTLTMKGVEHKTAKPVLAQPKPVAAQPLIANKPQTAPLATNNPPMEQADKPQPGRQAAANQLPAKQAMTPALATPHAMKPAASSPAVTAPQSALLVKEDPSNQIPIGDRQLADPINAHSK